MWVKCSERLPENDKEVQVIAIGKRGVIEDDRPITKYNINQIQGFAYFNCGKGWRYLGPGSWEMITHWRPLLEMPDD